MNGRMIDEIMSISVPLREIAPTFHAMMDEKDRQIEALTTENTLLRQRVDRLESEAAVSRKLGLD